MAQSIMNYRNSGRISAGGSRVDNVFQRASGSRTEIDDEEALTWAALEKLPTYERLRTAILKQYTPEEKLVLQQLDLRKLGTADRHNLIEALLKVADEDNEKFLRKLRQRIDRVGIEVPTIEVRFESLSVSAKCQVGGRALPTLWNAARNTFEMLLSKLGINLAKQMKLQILKNIKGIIRPGRMTLLLGPPSSGKTTLLLALAGKLDPGLKVYGRVMYNGHELDEFVPQKTSAYISQYDLHMGEMTVRETLEFSACCQGVGTRYELLSELAKREKQAGIFPEAEVDFYMKATAIEDVQSSIVTDYNLKLLGLDICADILVGDEMRRGISGGQRKRVTTGEMIVGPTKTLFMDEISTGLDSSTTFQIVKCLQQFVHILESTIFMSLLQPAPETFELFDDIVLLSEGQIVYQGPREHVCEFFQTCGFKCPERKGTADFLQEVTSHKDQEQYWIDKTKPYRYISVEEFAERFEQFPVGQKLASELAQIFDKSKNHNAALVFTKYSISKWKLFIVSFKREKLLLKRNAFVYIFKTVQILIMSCITMTVFLRTKMHRDNLQDANLYFGVLIFTLLIIMFNGYSELALTIFRLPVYFKQRDLLFYPGWAFSLPLLVLRIPESLLSTGVWSVVTYYVIGLAPSASRFFKHYLALFLVSQMSSSLFRLIAGLCRSMVLANTGGSFGLLVVFMLGGFIIPRGSIPKWWIWGYWISPLTYGNIALTTNEFLASEWDKSIPGSNHTLGIQALINRSVFHKEYWYWIGIGGLLGFVILFNTLFTLVLTYLKPLGTPQAVIPEAAVSGSSIPLPSRKLLSHVLTDNNGGVAPRRGMILPFKPLAMVFEGVNYYVDMPVAMKEQGVTESRLQLLRDVTGSFRPGVLTALMGISGAGKTTLMDVLAGRKTGGYIEGSMWISGFPKIQATFARISGYCEQTDIHSPQLTVCESLVFSAWLRLPADIDAEIKQSFVDEVLELVELDGLRDGIVGLPGVTGLSIEQRKRLTIAVELVANPSIIFMDEPTSGLDARAAAIVMRAVRNTVDTGRTVVCTIHQPSIDIFESFDELLLMKQGGQVIYTGSLGRHSKKLIKYFEDVPGVLKIKDGDNPATWMLEVSSVAAEQQLGIDFADIYKESSLFQRTKALVKELSVPAEGSEDLYFPTQYSESFLGQFTSCYWKQQLTYWRSPDYNGARFIFTLVASLVFGSIFWKVGPKRHNQQDLFTVLGAMYGSVIFIGISNCSMVQPIVATERTVFYRERAAGLYSALPFALAQVCIFSPRMDCKISLFSDSAELMRVDG
ncbi:hypothetical protein O6H91_09G000200 [Diphasiastrum complanatum]|uniref:Uncharacterized protein n=1 Tax=Diphasiastrum complanatum TaxID=34168 RepID=A0ACC2CKM5_DIPCM|nr:hypothetical protein O6H91_09G000200 [Diphasiastrum complanatum]